MDSNIVIPCSTLKYCFMSPVLVNIDAKVDPYLSQGVCWHSIPVYSNQAVCSFSTPHPRSTSFCAVSGFTHVGVLSDILKTRTNPDLQNIFGNGMPNLNCFNGYYSDAAIG